MSERWDKMSAEYRSSCLQYKTVLLKIVNIVYLLTLLAVLFTTEAGALFESFQEICSLNGVDLKRSTENQFCSCLD